MQIDEERYKEQMEKNLEKVRKYLEEPKPRNREERRKKKQWKKI